MHRRLQAVLDTLKTLHDRKQPISSSDLQTTKPKTVYDARRNEDVEIHVQKDRAGERPTHTHQSKTTPTEKTADRVSNKQVLIIGDSILKGIQRKGLNNNVHVKTLRGAKISDVKARLSSINVSQYSDVVVYVGGNNLADDQHISDIVTDMTLLIETLQAAGCTVYLCNMCPRDDTDVTVLDDVLREIKSASGEFKVINCYKSFVCGNGDIIRQYYHRDGIHLSPSGTSNFLRVINKVLRIMSKPTSRSENFQHSRYPSNNRYTNYVQRRQDQYRRSMTNDNRRYSDSPRTSPNYRRQPEWNQMDRPRRWNQHPTFRRHNQYWCNY